MSLINYIEKLQKKPKHIRTQIMWICVIICMAIVVGIWLITLEYSLPSVTGNDEVIKEVGGQFNSIKDSLKANVGSFFEEEEKEEEIKEEVVEEIPEESRIIQPGILPINEE